MRQNENFETGEEFSVEPVAATRRALGGLSRATFWRRTRDPEALALGFPRPLKIGGRSVVIVHERERYIQNLAARRDTREEAE